MTTHEYNEVSRSIFILSLISPDANEFSKGIVKELCTYILN